MLAWHSMQGSRPTWWGWRLRAAAIPPIGSDCRPPPSGPIVASSPTLRFTSSARQTHSQEEQDRNARAVFTTLTPSRMTPDANDGASHSRSAFSAVGRLRWQPAIRKPLAEPFGPWPVGPLCRGFHELPERLRQFAAHRQIRLRLRLRRGACHWIAIARNRSFWYQSGLRRANLCR